MTSDFDSSERAAQAGAGVPASRVGRGVAEQVALARRDSAHRGGRHTGTAKALVRETGYLSREDRAVVDAELAGPDGIAGRGGR